LEALDAFEYFFAMHRDMFWGVDSNSNLITLDPDYSDDGLVADH
jgi:hypothetical protein